MKTNSMTPALYEYVKTHCPMSTPVLESVIAETQSHPDKNMQISRDQGSFMHFLTAITGSRKALEVGCFTGYSAIEVASALPEDGRLYTLDIDAKILQQARGYFQQAELGNRIHVMEGPALQSLEALVADSEHRESFDIAFLDADKSNMLNYYELALKLLRRGGLILADNVLWHGHVIDKTVNDTDTTAIRKFNAFVRTDDRVASTMLHISDGIYLIRKL